MLDKCPICESYLINGTDSKLRIEYPAEKLQEFAAGLLSIEQLNEFAIFYYMRDRLCPNQGNNEIMLQDGIQVQVNPPCPNYYGGDMDNPKVIVETIRIADE